MLKPMLKSSDGQSTVFFVIFGAVVAWKAADYGIGTPGRMGAGFFPFVLGLLLVGLGILVGLNAIRTARPDLPPLQLKAVACLTAAGLVGGWALQKFGIAPAIIASTFIAALAERRPNWIRVAVVSVILVSVAWTVFVYGLNVRLALFRI